MTARSEAPALPRPWAYSAFPVEIRATHRLSPAFLRLTLAGEALANFAPWGADQRIKLVLPIPGDAASAFRLADFGLLEEPTPHPSDWYQRWRVLPETERNVLRTYTPAAIRPELGEIDVDVFLHEPAGPASAWAAAARPGDRLVVTGPDVRNGFTGYGLHWEPGDARRFLIIADETAFPAARNIVSALPSDAAAEVLLEVSDPADEILSTAVPAGVRCTAMAPGPEAAVGGERGIERALREWGERSGIASSGDDGWYVWIAGEAGATTRMRRYLTTELGIAKDRVAFLGYWRVGGALVG